MPVSSVQINHQLQDS